MQKSWGRVKIGYYCVISLRDPFNWILFSSDQCFGSGSSWIRIILPDPDTLQKTLIRIRVEKNKS